MPDNTVSIQAPLPATPIIDKAAHTRFETLLQESRFYLEYGSGGSTVFAANVVQVPKILAIESDPKWAIRVKETCLRNEESGVEVGWVNIGPTTKWGFPLNLEKNLHLFPPYSQWPWLRNQKEVTPLIRENEVGLIIDVDETSEKSNSFFEHMKPDLILIDGRFRPACFIQCLLHVKPGTRILFDDYVDRPNYHLVEEFAKPIAYYGNLAEFCVPELNSVSELKRVFETLQYHAF